MDKIFKTDNQLILDDYMQFETHNRGRMGEDIPLAVYRLMEFSLKDELTSRLGKEEQVSIFRGAGYRAGEYFAKNFLNVSLEQNAFIAQLQNALEGLHIGILRIESKDKEGNIMLTVAEDADCSGLPMLGETVCHYDEGFIGGIFSTYYNEKYVAEEVDCWATGDRVCRFRVKPE